MVSEPPCQRADALRGPNAKSSKDNTSKGARYRSIDRKRDHGDFADLGSDEGLDSEGFDSDGLLSADLLSLGLSFAGLVSPGLPSTDLPSPGLPSLGFPSPALRSGRIGGCGSEAAFRIVCLVKAAALEHDAYRMENSDELASACRAFRRAIVVESMRDLVRFAARLATIFINWHS